MSKANTTDLRTSKENGMNGDVLQTNIRWTEKQYNTMKKKYRKFIARSSGKIISMTEWIRISLLDMK